MTELVTRDRVLLCGAQSAKLLPNFSTISPLLQSRTRLGTINSEVGLSQEGKSQDAQLSCQELINDKNWKNSKYFDQVFSHPTGFN